MGHMESCRDTAASTAHLILQAATSQGATDTIPETPSQSLRLSIEQQVQARASQEAADLDALPSANPELFRILDVLTPHSRAAQEVSHVGNARS